MKQNHHWQYCTTEGFPRHRRHRRCRQSNLFHKLCCGFSLIVVTCLKHYSLFAFSQSVRLPQPRDRFAFIQHPTQNLGWQITLKQMKSGILWNYGGSCWKSESKARDHHQFDLSEYLYAKFTHCEMGDYVLQIRIREINRFK